MRIAPPACLVERLARLHLATPAQVCAVGARVRRLAGEYLEFESVWIDALAQAKVITPWQAAEFNAGRGDQLLCGSYVLTGRLKDPGYAECFSARRIDSHEEVRLYVCQRPQRLAGETLVDLKSLAARDVPTGQVLPIIDCGTNGKSVWAACPAVDAVPASQWLAENGRMPPAAVLQVARAISCQLAALERQGIVHSDISAAGLLIDQTGEVWLPAPALRGIVRPQEGISFAELRPDAYDYLAPERITTGSPPDIASDLYACGAVWWHLLAGRTPFAGGNSRAKLHAVQTARLIDVRSITQAVPDSLAVVMAQCLATDRAKRAASFAAIADTLGPPTNAGRELLASLVRSPMGTWHQLRPAPVRHARRKSVRSVAIGAACAATLFVAALWYLRSGDTAPIAASDLVVLTAPATNPSRAVAPPQEAQDVKLDAAVRPASATLPIEQRIGGQQVVEDLVLPTGEIQRIEQLDLEPQMRVRGRGGRRPLVSVPPQGLLVASENVTFEGIDFIWQASEGNDSQGSVERAIIRLQAQTVNFRGCSFSSWAASPPAAIRTLLARDRLGGFGTEVMLSDCVFDGVRGVVDHHSTEAINVTLHNCLCVASGPILSLARCPREDGSIELSLERVTTRGDTAVLEMQNARTLGKPGSVAITASGCALAGTSRAGLISLVDATNPSALVRTITWDGQGSVVSPRMPMLTAQSSSGPIASQAEDQLTVAGLVRGELEFAGRADGPPADSRVVRWQVPLRSSEPPGAEPDRLHSLRSERDE